MSFRSFSVLVLLVLSIHVGERVTYGQRSENTSSSAESSESDRLSLSQVLKSEDVLRVALDMNELGGKPSVDFKSCGARAHQFDLSRIEHLDSGFAVQLSSASPIPAPTVHDGRLYVSGGFSSNEYYCFDAYTGSLMWAVELDDVGPSSAVPHGDSIVFSCESCTLFSLDAATGKLRWSHWLGDPLLSTPTVANGRVFAVYPESATTTSQAVSREQEAPSVDNSELRPTHVAACFDADSGKVLWQRWIDSDCMSAPVATGEDVLITSLTGTVYRFDQRDGTILDVRRMNATSLPVVVGSDLYATRRADIGDAVAECIVRHDGATNLAVYATAHHSAPYLDHEVQQRAAYRANAVEIESLSLESTVDGFGFVDTSTEPSIEGEAGGALDEAFLTTQLQAAKTIGLDHVSTLQCFQGSRILFWKGQVFSCMGDRVVCVAAKNGEEAWSHKLKGDLAAIGGHLAAPPIAAGKHLLLATVAGTVLQLDPETGETVKSYDVGAPIRSPPVVYQGRIYVGTQNGRIVCIDTGDPELTGWPMWGGDPAHSNVARSLSPN